MYTLLLGFVTILALVFFLRTFYVKRKYWHLFKETSRYTFMLDHLSDGIIDVDANNAIVYMNRSAETLFGIKGDDIIGFKVNAEAKAEPHLAPLLEIFFPGKGGEVAHTIPKHGEQIDTTQDVIIKKGYEQKLRVYTVAKIDSMTKQESGMIKIVRDITQEDIINRNKSDLVTIVSHQLRTPLSGLKWILSALLDGDYGTLSKEQADLVSRGAEANDGLISLVDDMLDISKIERSEFIYTFEQTDMVALLKEIVSSKTEAAKAKVLTFQETYGAPVLMVPIDKRRIRIAIANIIDNAINYSLPNKTIEVGTTQDQVNAYIRIADQGIGIPEKSREHLFTKFFRAENAQRMRTQGTGLGLFLVKAIIAGHNGTISFESEEGKGTTFTTALPLKQSAIK